MKKQPLLENCFKCESKVFEFDDNVWGCDTCKSIWTYKGRAWRNKNFKIKIQLKQKVKV